MTDAQPTPISDQLNVLDRIDSSYDKRKVIDELDQDVPYSVSVVIDKIAKNYSYVREDGYRDAYYITGAISDSEHQVKVLLPTAMNSEVESWNEGETINLEAFISDWDLAYKRFGLLGHRSIVAKKEVHAVLDKVTELTPDSSIEMTDAANETDVLTSNTDSVTDKAEPDAQSEGSTKQEDVFEPVEQEVVEEVKAETVELEPIEAVKTKQAEEKAIDLKSTVTQPVDPEDAKPTNQEIEDFIEQMEAPTPLEQLAEDYADAQTSNSEDVTSIEATIPLLGNVPTLKNVPIRRAASTAPETRRFSNHTPVHPTRLPIEVQEDGTQDQAKKIIKIAVCVCVGIILLMCLCCGLFS